MGSSSSQPVHDESKSPKMDDLAASQQLIDEGASAGHANYNEQNLDDDAIESSPPVRFVRNSHGARKSKEPKPRQAPAASQVASPKPLGLPLRSYALPDLRAYTDSDETNEAASGWPVSPLNPRAPNRMTPHNEDVEVPDSQTASITAHARMSPPITSSFLVPASMPEKSSHHKKVKGRKETNNGPSKISQGEESMNRGDDMPTAASHVSRPPSSRSKRKRKHKNKAAPSSSSQTKPTHGSDVEDNIAAKPHPTVVDEATETSISDKRQKKKKKKKEKKRKELSGKAWKVVEKDNLDAEDEIIGGSSEKSKKRRQSKKSKTQTEPELDSGLGTDTITSVDGLIQNQNAENRTARQEKQSARPKHRVTKSKTNGINVYDWSDPVRMPGEHVDKPFAFGGEEEPVEDADNGHADLEQSRQKREKPTRTKPKPKPKPKAPVASTPDMDDPAPITTSSSKDKSPFVPPETSPSEDETPSVATSEQQGLAKKRRYKKGRKSRVIGENRPRIRVSNMDPSSNLTAAERSLNMVRDLNYPPSLGTIGDFTQDEEELIRRAIHDYQERKGLEMSELVDVIQWTDDHKGFGSSGRKKEAGIDEAQEEQESNEFWSEIKQINLTRKPEIIRSHIRSQYHAYKSGGWIKEEDDTLKNLFELHPRRWKLISHIMGDRSMHDVHNRWRDYIQYGDKRNTSTWTHDEESLLVRAITTVVQRDEDYRAEVGKPPLNDYINKDINWAQVSTEMGNIRSRLQSSVKWTKMLSRDPAPRIQWEIKPRKTIVPEHVAEAAPKKRGRPRKSLAQETPRSHGKRVRTRESENTSVTGAELNDDIEFTDGESGETAAPKEPNTKRKRKRSMRESIPRSRSVFAKKMKTQATSQLSPTKTYKSAELITESDDAVSEPES